MGFIDPRTDFGFKRIFGSPRSKSILRSFLNAIVYGGEPRIDDLEILDPFQQPDIPDFKLSILDLKAQLDDGSFVIIEMQVAKVEAFLKRILYNTAKAYTNQLRKKEIYFDLQPIVAVTITDFVLFSTPEETPEKTLEKPISRFKILEEETHQACSEDLRWIFVELPKFDKKLSELSDLADRWLFFLRKAGELQQAPEELTRDRDVREAFEIANESQLSAEELALFEAQRDRIWIRQGEMIAARREGLAEGIERGIEQGIERGIEQGIEQGIERGARQRELEIAREMLKTIAPETVSQMTGLPLEIVRDLAREL